MNVRLYPGPEDACGPCAGRGFRTMFDADTGYSNQPCLACGSVASAGYYLVRIAVGDAAIDASGQLASFEDAAAWARDLAEQVRLRGAIYGRRAEVRVEFVPFDEDEYRETVLSLTPYEPKSEPVIA